MEKSEAQNQDQQNLEAIKSQGTLKGTSLRSLALNDSLEDSSSWVSYLCFSFLNPIFDKSAEGFLEHKDLGGLSEFDRCENLHVKFSAHWDEEKQLPAAKRSLWRVLWRTCGYHKLFLGIFLYAVYQAEAFGPIEIMNRLVKYFEGSLELTPTGKGVLVSLIFILPLTKAVFAAHSNAIFAHVGIQMRNALITMIYRKSLRLSPTARQISSSGQILNMFSNDTQQVQRFMFCLNNTVIALPTIGVCLYLIYQQMHIATFVGLGFILLLLPFNLMFFGILNMFRGRKVMITDIRVKLMNEILSGIRIIKYYAWEKAFSEKITEVREGELHYLKLSAYIMAVLYTVLIQAVPVMLPILIFLTYIYLGNNLDPSRAFTAIALFNLMQFPFVLLPMGLSQFSQASVSCKRILEFLDAEELEPYVIDQTTEEGIVLEMKDANLGWLLLDIDDTSEAAQSGKNNAEEGLISKTSNGYQLVQKDSGKKKTGSPEKDIESHLGEIEIIEYNDLDEENDDQAYHINRSVNTLNAMNFHVKKGELVAVIGPVGSGKSSFLSALLGEMHLHSGTVRCAGSIAYCEQQAWILNDTVQGNILFGKEFNEAMFNSALYAANLAEDLKSLSAGLQTQIGEKGINLSGGQKARIALARAVYQDADVYLLDDPLSAVDAHVGEFLFNECICNVLAYKTRVLVTHHVHHLHRCDRIIVLDDGSIKFFGNYEEFKNSGLKIVDPEEYHDDNEVNGTSKDDDVSEASAPKEIVFIRNPASIRNLERSATIRAGTLQRGPTIRGPVTFERSPTIRSPGTLQRGPTIRGPVTFERSPTIRGPGTFERSPTIRGPVTFERSPTIRGPGTFERSPTIRSPGTLRSPTLRNLERSPTLRKLERGQAVQRQFTAKASFIRTNMEDLFGGSLKSRQGFSSAYMNEFNSSAFLTDMKAKGSGGPDIVPLSLSIDDWEQQTSSRSIFPALARSNDFMEVISMASVGRLTSVAKGGFADTTEDEGEPGTSVEMASKMTSAGTLMTKEERKEGDVEWSVYKYYCQAGGWYWAIAFALFALIAQVLQLLGAYWLQWWGTVSIRRKDAGDPLNQERNLYWLEIYIILGCGSIAAYAVRSAALAIHRIGVSELLQKDLLQRSMKAPISFFDTTPLGRILNRFSSDLSTVDEELTQTISSVMNCVVQVLGAVAGVVGATKGTFLVLFAPLGFFYFRLQRYFRVGNTNVARLESVSRSPVYADFSQALAGISSIRAYKDQYRFIQQLEALVNANSIANITQQLFSQWLAVRLDLIGSLISFGIALLAIVAPGFIPAGFVAVGLSYSFQLTTYSRMFVLLSSQYEAQMNSVERIKEYVDTIPKEGLSTELHETQIPKDWPTKGMIEARNISMRYRLDSPLVLKGISFKINSKEKIGVTGRTGSGKSSLMVALFRIQELSEGNLFIDNLDIATIPLDILRKRLGIIPQDPVMFSATIRFNLDPFEEYSDEEIWNALQAVDMKDHIMSLSHRLQEEVSEGGDNLSSGQRQLICIARAILRKPKILVLDEATASIDNETDALIQSMIRKEFAECTVLTIAHRLNTIIDYDRISVLDQGVLKELDAPKVLLADPKGLFHDLWEKHIHSHGESQS